MSATMLVCLGLLMGSLVVVTAQMKRDQREMSVQLSVPLSKSAVTKGTDGGEVVLREHELIHSSTSNDTSDWRRTFLVGQDLSVQLHKKLCPCFFGKARIHGLCKLVGDCGQNSLTVRSCTSIPNPPKHEGSSKPSPVRFGECLTQYQPNCSLIHDMIIIRELFHFNDSQSLVGLGNQSHPPIPVTDSTNVSTRHSDTLTNNHVATSTPTMNGNYTTLNPEHWTVLNATTPAMTWNPSLSCANFSPGKLFSYSNSCTQFVECVGKIPYVRVCPSGYKFHPKLLICDKGAHVSPHFCSNPKEKRKQTSRSNYNSLKNPNDKVVPEQRKVIKRETSSARREMRLSSCPVKGSDHYIQPHSEHCNKFEICSNGKIQVETCGLGALFNPLSLVCDLPHNVNCESRRIDFSTYDCQPEDKYKTSHPDQCDLFIECDKGNLHIKSCPPSTAYHFEDGECVHRYRAKCKKPISLEHDSDVNYNPHQSRRHKRSNSLNLACTFNYIAPHPHFCNKFIECETGRIFIKDCGPGTAYNPRLGQCDWPYNVRQPIPDDCSRYRQCHGTRYVEKTCGGTTIYDQEKGKCVFPTGKDYDTNCRKEDVVTPPPS